MRSDERRVRRLALRAPREELVRRGAILLEDALRTASLPGDGRTLIVRSLALGRIGSGSSPAALSLVIEEQLREAWARAVHAGDSHASSASAVFFRDELEPLTLLAATLARGGDARAWFWPRASASFRVGASRDDALRMLLWEALALESGPAGGAAFLQGVRERGGVDALLGALRPEDGATLLRAFGWSQPAALPDIEPLRAAPEPGPEWSPILRGWASSWGLSDTRTAWLAGAVLVAERPARLLDRGLARGALVGLVRAVSRPVPTGEGAGGRATRPPEKGEAAAFERLAIPPGEGAPAEDERGPRGIEPAPAEQVDLTRPRLTSMGRPAGLAPEESSPPPGIATRHPEGVRSEAAGLFFLLQVLTRLGMGDWLAAYPELLETAFPERLLAGLADGVGAPAKDPVRLVALPPRSNGPELPFFVMPQQWSQLCATRTRGVVRSVSARGGRLLTDGTGRLVLGFWGGRAPEQVRARLRGCRLQRRVAVVSDPLALALEGWRTAVRRWCRHFGGFGLHAVVCRPGRLAITPTHVDVFFDHRQADARLRRAGLDLDPGWVPWLGRVVRIHYLYGEGL